MHQMHYVIIYLMLSLFQFINCMPIDKSLQYLKKYGYLNDGSNELAKMSDQDTLKDAIAKFQHFAGLNETGKLNESTMKMMSSPRCGNRDFNIGIRVKRYVLEGSRWKRFDLTYQVVNIPYEMHRQTVYNEFKKAFSYWSNVSPLTFRRVNSNSADIKVAFYSGRHGDSDPFDGPGGTLAHSFFPRYGSDIHFDLEENWTSKSYSGTNLLQVATHEIGHALGLEHSANRKALMAPFYQRYKKNLKLHSDDIRGIQAIYGTKKRPKYSRSGRKRRKLSKRRQEEPIE